ncbi:MAG TPA: hypothetical protein VG963_29620 [Polyangiaceae bacterium]|nr:hypothetical protein [Polyangiaceae bacterium]
MSERVDLRPQGAQQDVGRVLQNGFYTASAGAANEPIPEAPAKRDAKPSHYKVICISMYTDDLKRLDSMVEALKARGLTKANRSALIRYALGEVDLDRVPKGL